MTIELKDMCVGADETNTEVLEDITVELSHEGGQPYGLEQEPIEAGWSIESITVDRTGEDITKKLSASDLFKIERDASQKAQENAEEDAAENKRGGYDE